MSIRYRNPESKRLEISQGDWLLVKMHLTAGEQRRMFKRMLNKDGIEPVNVGLSKMVTYLIDWSIDDPQGRRVEILNHDDETKAAIFDNLPAEDFKEILQAIEAHEREQDAKRESEKNSQGGESQSSAISPSPEPLAGDTSGLTHSTLMSIAS